MPPDRRSNRQLPAAVREKMEGKKKRPAEGGSSSNVMVFVGAGVALLAVIMYLQGGIGGERTPYESWLRAAGVKLSRASVVCGVDQEYGAPEKTCGLVAAHSLRAGNVVGRIPLESVIDAHRLLNTTLSFMAYDGGVSETKWFAELERRGVQGIWQSFVLTFWMWLERRKEERSREAPWLASLPDQPESPTEWSEEEVQCLDSHAKGDVTGAQYTLEAYTAAAAVVCSENPDLKCASTFPISTRLTATARQPAWRWVFNTLRQRHWGPVASPSIFPSLDMVMQRPGLCAPDAACDRNLNQNMQAVLSADSKQLELQVKHDVEGGTRLYANGLERAPWNALSLWGYVDRASNFLPDLDLLDELRTLKVPNLDKLPEEHPLHACSENQLLAFLHSGAPSRELKKCRIAVAMAAKHPELKTGKWDKGAKKVALAMRKEMPAEVRQTVWEALEVSASKVLKAAVKDKAGHCSEPSASIRMQRAVESSRITAEMAQAAVNFASKRKSDASEALRNQGVKEDES